MSDETLEKKDKLDAISMDLGQKLIALINETIIRPKKLTTSDAVYVATSTLMHVAAIVMFAQMPKDKLYKIPAFAQRLAAVLEEDGKRIAANRMLEDEVEEEGSAWTMH